MGFEFRAPPKGQENKLCREASGRIQLDGQWSFQAQFNALGACNQEDDNSFKENSVKEITDRGRVEGAARLQQALEASLASDGLSSLLKHAPRDRPLKRKALAEDADGGLTEAAAANDAAAESEVRKSVRALLQPLRELEKVAGSPARNNAALDIFRQLRRLNVTVNVLKATKVAAELNKPCWKGMQAAPEVRQAASSLVRSWKNMYRAQAGAVDDVSEANLTKGCHRLSINLEESVHAKCPKTQHYCRVVEVLCAEIQSAPSLSRDMMLGSANGKDLLQRIVSQVVGSRPLLGTQALT